ncbi:MAG TPA: 3'-5' exonuclease [Saprospiraceae bacterium]|nr:3'-5' exonuclease [Saprospiraceae bacterium]
MGECHIMIDLETMGTRTNSMILSIAAIRFDPKSGKHLGPYFYKKVNIDTYDKAKFSFDGDTLKWWMTLPKEARDEAFCGDNRLPIKNTLELFITWVRDVSSNLTIKPWSHGASFDIPILAFVMNHYDLKEPWSFWNIRDTRTYYETLDFNFKNVGSVPVEGKILPAHHPLGDCARQIEGIRLALNKWK